MRIKAAGPPRRSMPFILSQRTITTNPIAIRKFLIRRGASSTTPISVARYRAVSKLFAICSMLKRSLARFLARTASASLSDGGRARTSWSAFAQSAGSGSRSHATPSDRLVETSTRDSVGPPLVHATTGRPHAIPSTGPIPKCSFPGV